MVAVQSHIEDCGVAVLTIFVLSSGGGAGGNPVGPLGFGVFFVFIDLKYHGI